MKTFNFLILGLFLLTGNLVQAQLSKTAPIRQFSPNQALKPTKCEQTLLMDLKKASVRNPNHTISNKVKYYEQGGLFYVRNISAQPITENDFIWIQIPFKPGYPTGKITGLQFIYTVQAGSSRTSYISQSRITQGPQPYQGVVRLDDPTNLYNSGSHSANASGGGFACNSDFKTVGFKLVMAPGAVIRIGRVNVLFDCPGETVTFMCPTSVPNPKIKLANVQPSGNFVRYSIPVYNHAAFPDFLFSAAPTLPACGTKTNASRSCIDIYDENNQRIYGFCALGKAADMNNIWFAVKRGEKPPARVRIVLRDRGCNKDYSSNWISIPAS